MISSSTIFASCLFYRITTTSQPCGIFIDSKSVSLAIKDTRFIELICRSNAPGGSAIFVRDCSLATINKMCVVNCRHGSNVQGYGLDSKRYDLRSTDLNDTVYNEGSNSHTESDVFPFYVGGRNRFVYMNNNVTFHRQCLTYELVDFMTGPDGKEVASFSQFAESWSKKLFEYFGTACIQKYTYLNFINATITSDFFYNNAIPKRIEFIHCIFARIELPSNSGTGYADFLSCSMSFQASQLPSGCNYDKNCVFSYVGAERNRVLVWFQENCGHRSAFFSMKLVISPMKTILPVLMLK